MKDIRTFVKNLLKDKKMYHIPIDIVKLAKEEGFYILQQDLDGISGAILVDSTKKFEIDNNKGHKFILIDNYQSIARKNFTIAHELGHYFLEFNGTNKTLFAHRENCPAHEPNEIRANDFASELLMPYELIDNFVKEIKKSYTNYYLIAMAISRAFNVSQAAAEFRLDKYYRGV